VTAEFFHAHGRKNRKTVMTKVTVAFCNFANASSKWLNKRLTAYVPTQFIYVHNYELRHCEVKNCAPYLFSKFSTNVPGFLSFSAHSCSSVTWP
jgi:hypothetical protein